MGNSRTTAPKYYKVGATHARVRAKPRVQQEDKVQGEKTNVMYTHTTNQEKKG